MNRRYFAMAGVIAAAAHLMPGAIDGGQEAVARKRRRNRGGTAVARAAVTGTGGRVSVAVNCGSGQSSSQGGDSQAVARC